MKKQHLLSFVWYELWLSFTPSLVYRSFLQEQIFCKTNKSTNEIQKKYFPGLEEKSNIQEIYCLLSDDNDRKDRPLGLKTGTSPEKQIIVKHLAFITHFKIK